MELLANGAPVEQVIVTEILSLQTAEQSESTCPLQPLHGTDVNLLGFLIEAVAGSTHIYQLVDALGDAAKFDDRTVSGEDLASPTASQMTIATQLMGLSVCAVLRFHQLRLRELGLVFVDTEGRPRSELIELVRRVHMLLVVICGDAASIETAGDPDDLWVSTIWFKRGTRINLLSRPCGTGLQLGVSINSPPEACRHYVADYLGISGVSWEPDPESEGDGEPA